MATALVAAMSPVEGTGKLWLPGGAALPSSSSLARAIGENPPRRTNLAFVIIPSGRCRDLGSFVAQSVSSSTVK